MTQIAPQAVALGASAGPRHGAKPDTIDPEPIEVWLQGLSPRVLAAIAARTALRVAPLMSRDARRPPSSEGVSALLALRHAVFRASALARVAVKFPYTANRMNAPALVVAARAAAAQAVVATRGFAHWGAGAAAPALAAAADAAEAARPALAAASAVADPAGPFAIPLAQPAHPSFLAAYAVADGAVRAAARFDATAQRRLGASGLADLPLWPEYPADWADSAWRALELALPPDQGRDVWLDWYEGCLRGGSRGEAYELAFVSAPLDVWEQGPAAANAWIKKQLPKGSGRARLMPTGRSLTGHV